MSTRSFWRLSSQNFVFFVPFGRWANILGLSGRNLWHSCQKCTLRVQKTFLKKKVSLIWVTFLSFSLIEQNPFDFWPKIVCGFAKTVFVQRNVLTTYLWKKNEFFASISDIELSAFRRKKFRGVVKTPIYETFSNNWKKFFIGETLQCFIIFPQWANFFRSFVGTFWQDCPNYNLRLYWKYLRTIS